MPHHMATVNDEVSVIALMSFIAVSVSLLFLVSLLRRY
jgi:hypothetical protein